MMPACKCSTYDRNVLRTATGTAHWNDATGTGYAGDDAGPIDTGDASNYAPSTLDPIR